MHTKPMARRKAVDAIEKIYKNYWLLEEILVDMDGIAHNLLAYDSESFFPGGLCFLKMVQKQCQKALKEIAHLEGDITENEGEDYGS